MAGREETALASLNHPHREYLEKLARRSATLEAWLEAGLAKGLDVQEEEAVRGMKLLPPGYAGCSKDSLLLEAVKTGVWVWPARLDVGELNFDDTGKPWTLYHYTYEESFERLAKDISSCPEDSTGAEVSDLLFDYLLEDQKERNMMAEDHRIPDLELCSLDPARFRSKKEIRRTIFNGEKRSGESELGTDWDQFADFCIPLRVPVSACKMAAGSTMVHISIEVLHTLRGKAEAHEELMQVKRERAKHKRSVVDREHNRPGVVTFLVGGAGQQANYDDWEQEFQRKKRELVAGHPEVVNRQRREIGHWQKQLMKNWVKDHFHAVTEKQHARTAALSFATTTTGTSEHRSNNGVKAKAAKAAGLVKMLGAKQAGRVAHLGNRLGAMLQDAPEEQVEDKGEVASGLYKEYQEKAEGTGVFVRGSMTRMKERRGGMPITTRPINLVGGRN